MVAKILSETAVVDVAKRMMADRVAPDQISNYLTMVHPYIKSDPQTGRTSRGSSTRKRGSRSE